MYIKFKYHNIIIIVIICLPIIISYLKIDECSEERVEIGTKVENSSEIIVNDVEIVSNNISSLNININVKI